MATTQEKAHRSDHLGAAHPRAARKITPGVTRILEELLPSPADPFEERLGTVNRTFEEIRVQMETLTRELRAIRGMAARLIDEGKDANAGQRRTLPELRQHAKADISTREQEVLAHLLGGKSNREISRELGISEKTVKNHLWKIYRKIGVRSRTQLFHHLICS